MNILLNNNGKLRNLWWVAVYFLVLASVTLPFIFLSQHFKWVITPMHQAIMIIAASLVCQLFRAKPFSELTGHFNSGWIREFFLGSLMGAVLMLMPAILLYAGGWVRWQIHTVDFRPLLSVTGLFISVAVAEEFLFRGFLFQRLMGSIGVWGTQCIIAGYFLLIHLNNPGMTGSIRLFASINIFLASIMFGLAFLKTRSLAMPIGIHFMANWVQGAILGFGVSGSEEVSLLKPVYNNAPQWLTGSSFGLEASVPGLVSVVLMIMVMTMRKVKIQKSEVKSESM